MEAVNNPAESRFEVDLGNGQLAIADYERDGNKVILTHTVVPRAFEGKGIAGKLAKAAFEHIRAEHLRAVPVCSYMITYAKRHPEYADLVDAEQD